MDCSLKVGKKSLYLFCIKAGISGSFFTGVIFSSWIVGSSFEKFISFDYIFEGLKLDDEFNAALRTSFLDSLAEGSE